MITYNDIPVFTDWVARQPEPKILVKKPPKQEKKVKEKRIREIKKPASSVPVVTKTSIVGPTSNKIPAHNPTLELQVDDVPVVVVTSPPVQNIESNPIVHRDNLMFHRKLKALVAKDMADNFSLTYFSEQIRLTRVIKGAYSEVKIVSTNDLIEDKFFQSQFYSHWETTLHSGENLIKKP